MLYIAADHGGFKLKEELKKFLKREKIKFVDEGAAKVNPNDDYPDFARLVAEKVGKNSKKDIGILICRSGQGVCITANKFSGVRAGLVWNPAEARASRNDDMTNILCLPSDYITVEAARSIVKNWLSTPWSKEERHVRRITKISQIEKSLH